MNSFVQFLPFVISCVTIVCPVWCRFDVSIKRSLIFNGFHPEISSEIDSYGSGVSYPCPLLLVEYLPSSVFVDSEQLYALGKQNKILAFANMSINTEVLVSSEKAGPFKVYIFLPEQVAPKYIETINLPVHLRYQDASVDGGYKSIPIGQPSLFAKCKSEEADGSSSKYDMPCSYTDKNTCKWVKLTPTVSSASLSASVPVGSTKYVLYINIAQYFLVYGAVIYIARKIYLKRVQY